MTREFTLSDARQVAYAQYGDPQGVPVVFFQGAPSTRLQHPPLAITSELGARVIMIDRPGFGRSDPAPGRTLVQWAENVAEVLDHLDICRFRVAGVSAGGPYALATAWRWPDRVAAASVCGGSGPLELPGALRGMALPRRIGYWLARHAPRALRFIVHRHTDPRRNAEKFVERYTAHNPEADQAIAADPEFRSRYCANFREAYRPGPDPFADEVILCSNPWGFALSEIRVPVHFWHGSLDNSTPLNMSRGMSGQIESSRLTILEGQGHLFVYGQHWRDILSDLLHRDSTASRDVVRVPTA
jgi:pimeloyl-ACP methyl ester carboxylesterase